MSAYTGPVGDWNNTTEGDSILLPGGTNVVEQDVTSTIITTPGTELGLTLDQEIQVVPGSTASVDLVSQINALYLQLQASQAANHLGKLSDYKPLFDAVKNYYDAAAAENLDVQLDVSDIEAFTQSLHAYSELFDNMTVSFSHISAIDDTDALTSLLASMQELYSFYSVLERFKATIEASSTLTIPETLGDVLPVLDNVATQIDTALNQVEIFLGARAPASQQEADLNALSQEDVDAIATTTSRFNAWAAKVEADKVLLLQQHPNIQALNAKTDAYAAQTARFQAAHALLSYKLGEWGQKNFV